MDAIEMQSSRADFARLLESAGRGLWAARIREIGVLCRPGHAGRGFAQRHALELTLNGMLHGRPTRHETAEACLSALVRDMCSLAASLQPPGLGRLRARLRECLTGGNTLVPLFHLVRCAAIQRQRGFEVHFAGLADGATYDLLLSRDGIEAEVVCEVVSAEDGRDVHRGAWLNLVDRVDPELQNWLASHPGRYLLKMTLPQGLKVERKADATEAGTAALAHLHARISRLLSGQRRADHDEAAVLRLDPLLLAGAQASEAGLMQGLRHEFGPEAHLAVTAAGNAVFVMAARASREDEIAQAVQRRMAMLGPTRLSGTRPGILAMFVEDTDRLEWRILRDQLRLEGAARQFLTRAEARFVVAVTCASRLELLGASPPDAAEEGELRFRNPRHKQCGVPALAAAVLSTT